MSDAEEGPRERRFALAGRGNRSFPPSEALKALVAERLREARAAAGISQRDAAGRVGIHDRTLWAMEQGDYVPRLGLLELLAEAYSKPLWWFMYEQPPAGEGERRSNRDRWRGAGGQRRADNDPALPTIGRGGEEEEGP